VVIRRRAARCFACALIVIAAGSAAADDTSAAPAVTVGAQTKAPWLTSWLPPPPPDLDPLLADGFEASLELGTGVSVSGFATSMAMSQTAECGWFLASSTKQALGIEAVEKLQLAVDHTTPEFAMLGAGLRRIGRRNIGRTRTVDFERVHAGLALASRGSNLNTGLGAGVAFGFMSFNGIGFDVSLDGSFLEPSDLGGPEKPFMVTVGLVYSPLTGTHAAPPLATPPPAEHRGEDHHEDDHHDESRPPCRDLAAYQDALARERKSAVGVCNQGPSNMCDMHKTIVTKLSAQAKACYEGEDVGPPKEIDDAPPP
jgi:hypothetical protein